MGRGPEHNSTPAKRDDPLRRERVGGQGSLMAKDEILEHIGLMGRQRICFEDDGNGDGDGLSLDNQPGDGDGGEEDWHQGLSEDLREHESLKDYKVIPAGTKDKDGKEIAEVKLVQVPETLVKSHVNQQKLIGSKVVIPKEDATQEELDKFYTAIGRPETPEGYEFKQEEGWKEIPYSDELEAAARQWFFSRGIPAKAAGGLFVDYQGWIKGQYDKANEEMNQDYTDGQKALKDKWGNKAEENIKLADRAFHTVFAGKVDDETIEGRAKARVLALLGSDAWFIEKMHTLSELLGEDQLVGMEEGDIEGAKTREELRAIMADPRYGKDEAYTKKVDEAYKQAFPG